MAFAVFSANLRVSSPKDQLRLHPEREDAVVEGQREVSWTEEGKLTVPSIVEYVLFLPDKLTVVGYFRIPNCSRFPQKSEDSAAY